MQLRDEVKELNYRRDLAQAELDKLRKRVGEQEKTKNMVCDHVCLCSLLNLFNL